MIQSIRLLAAVAAAALLTSAGPARAADPGPTTITISDLDCPVCAKKVTDQLHLVKGVGKVETDLDKGTVKVHAKGKSAPSPKALWEAVVKAKKTPEKIESPAGTFTSKPPA